MEAWSICAVVGFLQILVVQGNPPIPPPQCRGPQQFTKHPRECCNIPDIFEEKVFIDCGFPTREQMASKDFHHNGPDCKKSVCVLDKYNLLKSGEDLDKEKFAKTINEWSDAHPDWKPATEKVKERCLSGELRGPPQACEVDKALFCTTLILIENCPVWEESDDCDLIKKHIEQCKGPF